MVNYLCMKGFRFTTVLATLLLTLSPFQVGAAEFTYDAAVRQGSITFSRADLFADEVVRIYGNLINLGTQDVAGMVTFYQGSIPLGDPQLFSLRAQSASEDFWVDWMPSAGTYNIMMSISSTNPQDQNLSNNIAVTPLMTIAKRPPPPPPPPPTPAPQQAQQNSQAQSGASAQAPGAKNTAVPASHTVTTLNDKETSSLTAKKNAGKPTTSLTAKKGVYANQIITPQGVLGQPNNNVTTDSGTENTSSTENLPTYPTPIQNSTETMEIAERNPAAPESSQGGVLVVILLLLSGVSLAAGTLFWKLSNKE